jgi:hypothetical protein
MMTQPLTVPLERRAARLNDKVMASPTLTRRNYTGLNTRDRYLKGYMGELGFDALLTDFGARHEYKPRTDGKPDGGDFVVWRQGRRFTIDLKTAGEAKHRRFMMPLSQYRRKERDLYVGGRLILWSPGMGIQNQFEAHGFLPRKEVGNLPVEMFGVNQVPTLWAWLDPDGPEPRLWRIETLLGNLDMEEAEPSAAHGP